MNLEYLRTFIEVVRLSSLSQAARKLYLTQPAVSFQIHKLEKELGYRLIDRDRHHFSLTAKGKRFFQFAEYVHEGHIRLQSDIAQIDRAITGSITVAATPILAEYVVPNLISKFKEGKPAVDVAVNIMDSLNVIETVKENPDIVGFSRIATDFSELNVVKLGEDEVVLIVYPGHPFAIRKRVLIADLLGECLILRGPTIGHDHFYTRTLKNAGIDLDVYQPKIVAGTASGVVSAVRSKAGIGLISNLAITDSEAAGKIKVTKIANIDLSKPYYFVHNIAADRNDLLADFVFFIGQHKADNFLD
jgi:DNA-binding transcriptional LysR family regulator